MASAVWFLDQAGAPLLARNYKGDVPQSAVDEFPSLLLDHPEPCFVHAGVNYLYIRHTDIILLAVSTSPRANAMAVLQFLHKLIAVLEKFVKNVEEESVRDNFVIIYELLDEMADFGVIQTTDANLLEDYVTQSGYQLEVSTAVSALTDKVSWRPWGIWYNKNELFVDVREVVNTTINAEGKPITTEILGKIHLKVFLSGMPTLKLGINDKEITADMTRYRASRYVQLQEISFHQCVSLEKYEADGTIEFIPPDGEVDLATYRVERTQLSQKPLFKVEPVIVRPSATRINISCTITARYRKRQMCSFVEFKFPVPPDCDSPRCKTSAGNVVYAPEHSAVVWRIRNFGGGRSATMKAELRVSIAPDDAPEASQVGSAPVLARFEMPGVALSGMAIRYLKINEPHIRYQAMPWVRYESHSGQYEIRRAVERTGQTKQVDNRHI